MRYEAFELDRPGGTLYCGRWGHGAQTVVALHGLTGSHVFFEALADQLDDGEVTLIAPDLRGRGRSSTMGPPYGMAPHADDTAALLDRFGADDAIVVGHSMGGFVAVVTADRHPQRVRSLVLVDGGLPLDLTGLAGRPVEEVIRAITGPALDRLALTFPSADAYLDYWRQHPAFIDGWNEYAERLYRYDLVGEEPELRSSVNATAVLEDSASELRSGDVERALAHLAQPVTLLRAERGILNQVPPLYPDEVIAGPKAELPQLEVLDVPGTNHYSILLDTSGSKAVAAVVRDHLERS